MLISVCGENRPKLLSPQISPGSLSCYSLSLLKYIELMGDSEISSISPQNVELFKNRAAVKTSPIGVGFYFRALKSRWN
jgi:hypothetical protein